MSKIHKTAVHHFCFTEKVYRTVIESVRRHDDSHLCVGEKKRILCFQSGVDSSESLHTCHTNSTPKFTVQLNGANVYVDMHTSMQLRLRCVGG